MPTRYLKPGIRDSERINALSADAEVFYYRLIVTVDDFGRADARPAMLKAACFPVKDSATSAKCAEWLDELARADLIIPYESGGKPYLQMQKWDNQPRAKDSKFPAPADACIQTYADARSPRTVLPVTGTGTENRNARTDARASDEKQPTKAGTVCRAMMDAKLSAVNPGDPRLIALIDQGATVEEFTGLAAEAVSKGKGFAWVMHVLAARREEAAKLKLAPVVESGPSPMLAESEARRKREADHAKASQSAEAHEARRRAMEAIRKV